MLLFSIVRDRGVALGAAISTGVMYITMVRTCMKCGYRVPSLRSRNMLAFTNGHKEFHAFIGKCMVVCEVVHVVGHMSSTMSLFAM